MIIMFKKNCFKVRNNDFKNAKSSLLVVGFQNVMRTVSFVRENNVVLFCRKFY